MSTFYVLQRHDAQKNQGVKGLASQKKTNYKTVAVGKKVSRDQSFLFVRGRRSVRGRGWKKKEGRGKEGEVWKITGRSNI